MKKKFLAVALAMTMVAGLTACGSSSNGTTAENGSTTTETTTGNQDAQAEDTAATGGKVLSVQIGPDPETIDPALNSAVDGGNMILHAFECLLTVDQDGNIAPGQAETWETSEDGLTWTFHLRDGLKWSDGTDLTANDFVYSWKRVCDPLVAAPYAETVLSMVKGYEEAINGDLDALAVSAPDDKTFVVELSAACPYFDSIAAFATLSPVQQATIETNGDAWATAPETYVSNGPLYVTEWVPGSHITFSKNPNYWNADAVKLDAVKFVLMEDSNAAYSAYQTGDVSMIKDVPTEEIPSLEGNEEFHVEPIIGTYYVNLNAEVAPFDNAEVRKALSLAIDREYVAGTLMQGTYTAAGSLFGPGWSDPAGGDFSENANGGKPYIDTANFDANLEQAKQILADAGYPNGEGFPTITYTTNDTAYHKVVAEYLQQAWAELGVTLEVNIVEWSSFTPMRRSGDYEVARNGWVGDYSDPSNMLNVFYSTNGNNDGNYVSADFDAAFDAAAIALDPAERSAALHTAEDTIMNDAGCIPIAYYNDFWLQSSNITGMWHSAYGYWYFMYADIAE
ncbi:peptide ABC transporter substrate-binding protein [Konateibacter massiliensis]|uniref:peptide ABC transporter substrate-binding protein n=1 Tax=Konateibacter massiliensis TaxID=2002841 RepID=UPI000C154479|nr:peptide ABC transporter substrate-binding protein [Konateibacter massiliensis]